jgi:hypothetical protein
MIKKMLLLAVALTLIGCASSAQLSSYGQLYDAYTSRNPEMVRITFDQQATLPAGTKIIVFQPTTYNPPIHPNQPFYGFATRALEVGVPYMAWWGIAKEVSDFVSESDITTNSHNDRTVIGGDNVWDALTK